VIALVVGLIVVVVALIVRIHYLHVALLETVRELVEVRRDVRYHEARAERFGEQLRELTDTVRLHLGVVGSGPYR
jgi:cell division protein FtsL